VLAHQLGQDLILASQFGFDGGGLLSLGILLAGIPGLGFKNRCPLLEQLFLPLIKKGRRNAVFLADLRQRQFLDQVLT
jgi:hypothetical protein